MQFKYFQMYQSIMNEIKYVYKEGIYNIYFCDNINYIDYLRHFQRRVNIS